jgi:hypothetical protein
MLLFSLLSPTTVKVEVEVSTGRFEGGWLGELVRLGWSLAFNVNVVTAALGAVSLGGVGIFSPNHILNFQRENTLLRCQCNFLYSTATDKYFPIPRRALRQSWANRSKSGTVGATPNSSTTAPFSITRPCGRWGY